MHGPAALTHKTAVVLIPPEDVWEQIQALRRRYDRHVARWMPHVTLLYPFRPVTEFAAALPTLEAACRACPPFEVELAQFRFFAHGARGFTMWLAPEPRAELVQLHAALLAVAPECDDTARGPQGFTPHLSVGQAPDRRTLDALLTSFRAAWRPLRFRAACASLIARDDPPADVFRVEREIALGK